MPYAEPERKKQYNREYRERKNAARREKYHTDSTYRERMIARTRETRLRDPDYVRRTNLRKYNLTLEQFEAMEREQNGLCAICHKPPIGRMRLAVDHRHDESKRVRALLCLKCNTLLGAADDSPDRLRAAALYVERFTPSPAVEAFLKEIER